MDLALEITAWSVSGLLMLLGLAGTFLPIVPGPLIIFLGAVAYWGILWGDTRTGWIGFLILFLLLALTQAVEMASSAVGAKVFGSTKWGAFGAIVGGLIGMFFGIIGIIAGPLVGVFAFEMLFAKQEWKPATKSTWGTLVGAAAGVGIKVIIGVAMVIWFVVNEIWVGL
jgi:uncharacterized protein